MLEEVLKAKNELGDKQSKEILNLQQTNEGLLKEQKNLKDTIVKMSVDLKMLKKRSQTVQSASEGHNTSIERLSMMDNKTS